MPYLFQSLKTEDARAQAALPRSGVTPDLQPRIAYAEIWCSCFTDPGEDYCITKFFSEQKELLHSVRQNGY